MWDPFPSNIGSCVLCFLWPVSKSLIEAKPTSSMILMFGSNINLPIGKNANSAFFSLIHLFMVPFCQIEKMALKSEEEKPPPPSHTLTCGFIPEKPEKVIKHNEDLCRTKWPVSAGERAGKARSWWGRAVGSGIFLWVCKCVSVCVHLTCLWKNPVVGVVSWEYTSSLFHLFHHTSPNQSLTWYSCHFARQPIAGAIGDHVETPETVGSPFVIYI